MGIKINNIFILSLKERHKDRLVPLIYKLYELDIKHFRDYTAIKNDNGALGLLKTVENLFTECLNNSFAFDKYFNQKNTYENILVFEDDVSFLRNDFNEQVEKVLEQLPLDYDCCFLGCNLFQTIIYKYSPNLLQLYDAFGLQSVIYSRKGMEKILEAIKEMETFIPLDVLIQKKIMPDGKCYCSFPSLTSQIVSYSDIENKVMDWRNVLETRFNERTKHLL